MSYGAGNPVAPPPRPFVMVFWLKWNTCALDFTICASTVHRHTVNKTVVARGSVVCVRVGKSRCTRNHHILERMAGWGRLSWPGSRAGVGLGRGHGWLRRALLALGSVASWEGRYAGWNLWGTGVVQPFWDPRGVGEGRFMGCRGGIFQHQVRAW